VGGGLIMGAFWWVTWRERATPAPTAET
jgi:hypothetical protein